MKTGFQPAGRTYIDRDTYMTAVAMIDKYGDDATKHAARRSSRFENDDDAQGSCYWDDVIVAILELERAWLRPGECPH